MRRLGGSRARQHVPTFFRQCVDRAGSRLIQDRTAWPSVRSVAPRFTLALTKASIDAAELSAIIARRIRPERVSRYLACLRRGLGWLVSRSITSTAPATRILPALSRSKKASPRGREFPPDRLR